MKAENKHGPVKNKKCPFCKSEVTFLEIGVLSYNTHIRCDGCGVLFFLGHSCLNMN